MPKKGRAAVDPLKNIAASGFIGYVEEEEEHAVDEPGVIWVEIDAIENNPYQHAEDINPDDFQSLVESIKADGFLGALNVSPHKEESRYFLNGGGHQRRDAARVAGLSKVPVFVTAAPNDPTVLALRVARENTARVNVSMINLGNLYQHMIDEFGWTQDVIAQAVQKDRNHVKFALTAARSPDDIQDMLRQRPDSLRAMTYFRRLERVEDRKPIMERFLVGEIATEGVRQEVEAVLERQRHGGMSNDAAAPVANEPIRLSLVPSSVAEQDTIPTQPRDIQQPLSAPAHHVPEPSLTVVHPVGAHEDEENVQRSQEMGQEPLASLRETSSQEDEETLHELQSMFDILQHYRRSVFTTRALTEAEYRILSKMTVVTQQLLENDERDVGV